MNVAYIQTQINTNCLKISSIDSISMSDFLHQLKEFNSVRNEFNSVLAKQPYRSFFWECTPMTTSNLNKPFECVIMKADYLANRSPNIKPFQRYLDGSKKLNATFLNIGGDATLIAPKQIVAAEYYTDIASFIRNAPKLQIDQFWEQVAACALDQVSEKPLWLNTSGGGVAWLHARLDQIPKYYKYLDYKIV